MLESITLASSLREKLSSQHLPIIRQTSVQLINLLSSPTSDIHQIARTILQDLAFTARVLTIANSAYYRRSAEKTTTITQAILQVGYTSLRDIAIHSSLLCRRSRLFTGSLHVGPCRSQ